MMEWIKVEDQIPVLNETVLAWNGYKIFVAIRQLYFQGKKNETVEFKPSVCCCCEADESDYYESITHWMSLPEPPKKDILGPAMGHSTAREND